MARIKTSSAKAKGRRLQQWCCAQISRITDTPWGADEEIASREMGQAGTDVRLTRRLRKLFPFSVECKWQESWSVPAFIKQAKANRLPDTDWLLVLRRKRHEPIAVIDAELFFWLVENVSPLNLREYIFAQTKKTKGGE